MAYRLRIVLIDAFGGQFVYGRRFTQPEIC